MANYCRAVIKSLRGTPMLLSSAPNNFLSRHSAYFLKWATHAKDWLKNSYMTKINIEINAFAKFVVFNILLAKEYL